MKMQSKFQNPSLTLGLSDPVNVTIIFRFCEARVMSGISYKAS